MTPSRQLLSALKSRFAPSKRSSPALGSRINIQNDFTSFYQNSINLMIASLRKSSASEPNYSNNAFNHFNSNNIVISSIFNEMLIYHICLWLYANPNILQLANSMNLSMQTLAADGLQFTPSIFSALSSTAQDQYDKKAFEDLVRQIIKCDLNLAKGIEWLQVAKRHFGNFRNKLINNIEELVEDFKKKELGYSTTSSLQKEEIIAFVDESVTINILNWWLNATNEDELHAQNSISHLCIFIQSVFAINYTTRDIEKTKH
ncbi:10361_t:CDS:2 [Dentiscutata erythropus]|uniref:10361_t:CDS:1 n=1 Tax=Dentiscutata erythropus TaxID=1348616 RepID=A0A9N9J726_9GLOM|nr:10361_t:CDS:2 [Dentiscutata erythropus]